MKKIVLYLAVAGLLLSCTQVKKDPASADKVDGVLAYLREYKHLPLHPDIDSLASELERAGQKELAGMAYYISGAGKNIVGEDESAMEALKKAEQLLQEQDADPFYMGMTYYKMGRISENEHLGEVALHYYRQAEPYLEANGEPLYLASVYRELARMLADTTEQRAYFCKAICLAESHLDTLTLLDIRYAMLSMLEPPSPERLEISAYLCDHGQKRYAQDLVRAALRRGDHAQAEHYLKILSTDSTSLLWSQEKQAYLGAVYQHEMGHDRQAFLQLQVLYDSLAAQLDADGRVRSFAIAQRFDNAAEREKNLQLELRQQQLYAFLACLMTIMFVILATIWGIATKRRSNRLLEEVAHQAEIKRLQSELDIRQESLKKKLMQRVELSKNLQESNVRHKGEGELPEWARLFVETNIFQSEAQWTAFKTEFNQAYAGLLDRLKMEHPALTAVDQQVIALILLDMDISDICLLLNQTKRTVWSRRQRIKEHLGLTDEEKLDEWLFDRIDR